MIGSIQRKGREEAVNSIVTYNVEGSLPLQITKTAFFMIAVYIVIGFVAGALIAYFWMKSILSKEEKNSRDLLSESKVLQNENKDLSVENARLKTELDGSKKIMDTITQSFEEERTRLQDEREQSEANAEKLRKESEIKWQLQLDKLKEEIQNTTTKIFAEKQNTLEDNNRQQLEEMLKPIKERFEEFKKSVDESRTSNEVAKKELKDSFENTMKLFAQQQNNAVEALKQETSKIGNDANNLTNALKRDTKKQGNWGELILETLLESSGLEKDRHYFIQETVKDDSGKMWRPDVIVKFPEGRSVIIDSKVSLTAYTEAFEADNEELRRRRLKDHAKSVRKHVDELADKDYDNKVTDAIGFTLMFIPNDQCYLAALEEDADLSRYAYGRGVVIISPSNLMMALQLAFNMWKQDLRNKKIDEIVKTATELYEKAAIYSKSMTDLGDSLTGVLKKYEEAKKQLFTGKGNLMTRVENLKKLGITPKKQILGLENEDETLAE